MQPSYSWHIPNHSKCYCYLGRGERATYVPSLIVSITTFCLKENSATSNFLGVLNTDQYQVQLQQKTFDGYWNYRLSIFTGESFNGRILQQQFDVQIFFFWILNPSVKVRATDAARMDFWPIN